MAKKKEADDYGLQANAETCSLDPAVTASLNQLTSIPPIKVVADVHKQLMVHFQPAIKNVAKAGFNLLRALHNVQKMSEDYVKSVEVLAISGDKAFPAGKDKASQLKHLANGMRQINKRHQDTLNRLGLFVAKVNDYGHSEKDKLKTLSRGFESREKSVKKTARKKSKNTDPQSLDNFYMNERNLALTQQYQRYKFMVDSHNDWLRDYMSLLGVFQQILPAPAPPTQDNPTETANVLNVAVKDAFDETEMFDDDGYIAPCAYSEQDDSIPGGELPPNNTGEAHDEDVFFNDNFTMQRPEEPQDLPPLPTPQQRASPGPIMHYRENPLRASGVNKALNAMMVPPPVNPPDGNRFRDVSTGTQYDHQLLEPVEPASRHFARPSSMAEPNLQPTPVLHRNISDRIASLSMNALNDSINAEERQTSRGVMFRPSNVNAIPTAFVQQPFMTSDYGKMLMCIHNFHGQTSNQLSLRSGDKVVLIKCGSKGWVFTKHIETQRTGWFPSRYVRIIPDVQAPSTFEE